MNMRAGFVGMFEYSSHCLLFREPRTYNIITLWRTRTLRMHPQKFHCSHFMNQSQKIICKKKSLHLNITKRSLNRSYCLGRGSPLGDLGLLCPPLITVW